MRVVSVMIGLAALYETVEGFGGGLPFALDADGCVVDYQPECAAQDVHHIACVHHLLCAPHRLLTLTGSAPACAASTTTPLCAVR